MKNEKKVEIGIIGAMDVEVDALVASLEEHEADSLGYLTVHRGLLGGRRVAIVRCGIGKVFAAMAAEALILTYAPKLLVNTGVGGAIASGIRQGDVLVAKDLVQHDMDTSPLGDPKGLVSGINKIYFETDERAGEILLAAARENGIRAIPGRVASGDVFVADSEKKTRIAADFGASVCEMEGAAIAEVAYANGTPFIVIRAVSDSADEAAGMSYAEFLPIAAKNSEILTRALVKAY